jgi:hypothetical protein
VADNIFKTQEEKDFFSSLLNKVETLPSSHKERNPLEKPTSFTTAPHLSELLNRIKGTLGAMKAFAFLSKDKFVDAEMGVYFHKIITEEIEKTVSLLDIFQDYISINTPLKKTNTVNMMIEQILRKYEAFLEEKEIRLVKKQFEENLPETIVPDEQLRYIFDSVIQYAIHSVPHRSNIGILTRLFDIQNLREDEKALLQKDGKYLEILIVFTSHPKQIDQLGLVPGLPSLPKDKTIDLVLQLVREVIQKNRGIMKLKVEEDKLLQFISLILPVERREVVQYPSLGDRIKKSSDI